MFAQLKPKLSYVSNYLLANQQTALQTFTELISKGFSEANMQLWLKLTFPIAPLARLLIHFEPVAFFFRHFVWLYLSGKQLFELFQKLFLHPRFILLNSCESILTVCIRKMHDLKWTNRKNFINRNARGSRSESLCMFQLKCCFQPHQTFTESISLFTSKPS